MASVKELYFLDAAYEEYINLPDVIKQEFGFKFWQIQNGKVPENSKKMVGIPNVFELRAWDREGTYRAIYTTVINEKIIVLHAFKKKSQKTPRKSMELIKIRLKQALTEFR